MYTANCLCNFLLSNAAWHGITAQLSRLRFRLTGLIRCGFAQYQMYPRTYFNDCSVTGVCAAVTNDLFSFVRNTHAHLSTYVSVCVSQTSNLASYKATHIIPIMWFRLFTFDRKRHVQTPDSLSEKKISTYPSLFFRLRCRK